jgi:Peptidase C13 family
MIDSDSSSGLEESPPEPLPAPVSGFWSALRRNLLSGVRAAVFLPVRRADVRATPGQIVALVVIGLAVQLLFAVLREGVPGELDLTALPRALVYVPLALLCGWVIAWRERVPALLVAVPVLFCSVSLPYDVAFEALDFAGSRGWFALDGDDGAGRWLWYALYAAWFAAMVVGIFRLAQVRAPRALFHAAVFGVTIAIPLWYLPTLPLWEARLADEPEDADWYALNREDVFYAQPVLLDRALEALEPERQGVEDLYFVGVAGYAAEDVFMKEMAVVRQLFRERFDADGRMVTLVNNPRTVAQLPVASATALARTLERVGEVLDPDEDVLFLYLTSHGSEDHRLAMQFWPLQLDDIDPEMLKRMLDESGIKWRVIVISACYSGGFVEPLKDEHTMIVTAADALHQSFGCGSASDFTYFAKAYFDEALRGTYSFQAAFDQARTSIDARERAEGRTPSNPQIYVGAAMEEKLRRLSERLHTIKPLLQVKAPAPPSRPAARACQECD